MILKGRSNGSAQTPSQPASDQKVLPPQQNLWVVFSCHTGLRASEPPTLTPSRAFGRPIVLIVSFVPQHCPSTARGKKPKEGVWGNLRSWLPQDSPTDFAEEPEKLMKGLLIHLGHLPPKTHDLVYLHELLASACPNWTWPVPELRFLSRAAITLRYPGESAERQDAAEALQLAHRMRQALLPLLEKPPTNPLPE